MSDFALIDSAIYLGVNPQKWGYAANNRGDVLGYVPWVPWEFRMILKLKDCVSTNKSPGNEPEVSTNN